MFGFNAAKSLYPLAGIEHEPQVRGERAQEDPRGPFIPSKCFSVHEAKNRVDITDPRFRTFTF